VRCLHIPALTDSVPSQWWVAYKDTSHTSLEPGEPIPPQASMPPFHQTQARPMLKSPGYLALKLECGFTWPMWSHQPHNVNLSFNTGPATNGHGLGDRIELFFLCEKLISKRLMSYTADSHTKRGVEPTLSRLQLSRRAYRDATNSAIRTGYEHKIINPNKT